MGQCQGRISREQGQEKRSAMLQPHSSPERGQIVVLSGYGFYQSVLLNPIQLLPAQPRLKTVSAVVS